jgi:hypothetical protein
MRKGTGRDRHISVRAVRRDPPDVRKLGRAVVQLALAQAAAEAAAQQDTDTTSVTASDTARRARADGEPDA